MEASTSSRPFRRIVAGLGLFVAVCLAGVVGYLHAGWDYVDAMYMVIITVFGVGFGEVRPVTTPELRLFTMGLIVGGYGAAIYAVGGFVQMITEGEINRALGARRMTREIRHLGNHTILCGFGRMGRILAQELARARREFIVIDRDHEKIREATEHGYLVLAGDASDEETLIAAGVERCDTVATVLPNDAANVFITLTVRQLAPGAEIIARAEDPRTEKKLLHGGATKVVLPTAIGAQRVADLITRSGTEGFLAHAGRQGQLRDDLEQIGLKLEDLRIPSGSPLIGRHVGDIEVRGNRGFLIVAVRHADGSIVVNPSETVPLAEHDVVVVLGHTQDLPLLKSRYELRAATSYRGAR